MISNRHYRAEGPGFYYCPTCDADNKGIMGLCVWPCRPHLIECIQAVRELCDTPVGLIEWRNARGAGMYRPAVAVDQVLRILGEA